MKGVVQQNSYILTSHTIYRFTETIDKLVLKGSLKKKGDNSCGYRGKKRYRY